MLQTTKQQIKLYQVILHHASKVALSIVQGSSKEFFGFWFSRNPWIWEMVFQGDSKRFDTWHITCSLCTLPTKKKKTPWLCLAFQEIDPNIPGSLSGVTWSHLFQGAGELFRLDQGAHIFQVEPVIGLSLAGSPVSLGLERFPNSKWAKPRSVGSPGCTFWEAGSFYLCLLLDTDSQILQ